MQKTFIVIGAVALALLAVVYVYPASTKALFAFGQLSERSAAVPTKDLRQKGIVTFTFDDASKGQYEYALPAMRAASLRGTLYVTTHDIDLDPWNVTWGDLREFVRWGWEIGAHTHTHPYLTSLSSEELEQELTLPKMLVAEHVGVTPTAFAAPFGEVNDVVLTAIARHYESQALSWGEVPTTEFVDHFRVNRLTVMHTHDVHEVCTAIREAGERRQWLILAFHQIVDGTPQEYSLARNTFEQIVSCATTTQQKGSVQVLTVSEALRIIPHQPSGIDVRSLTR